MPTSSPLLRSGATPLLPARSACVLMVHGGAWDIPTNALPDHRAGLALALRTGARLLQAGAPATTVVAETVTTLEAHGAFDAGRGAVLTRRQTVELDAGVMCGATLRYGGVACTQHLVHPARVAHHLLQHSDGQVRLLVGAGAERYAEAAGFALVEAASLIHPRERQRFQALQAHAFYHSSFSFLAPPAPSHPQGTVGCVARDCLGHVAAATSTGGTPFRPSGRVGDSPLAGAGVYADGHAAASATGWGEAILTVQLTSRAADEVRRGLAPEQAACSQLRQMAERVRNPHGTGATGGLLLLSRAGYGAWAYTTPRMARGHWVEGHDPWLTV
ncbi:MAG: isoaspartyl peptidase/L-asparaginase [Bacteroidota bacterium]